MSRSVRLIGLEEARKAVGLPRWEVVARIRHERSALGQRDSADRTHRLAAALALSAQTRAGIPAGGPESWVGLTARLRSQGTRFVISEASGDRVVIVRDGHLIEVTALDFLTRYDILPKEDGEKNHGTVANTDQANESGEGQDIEQAIIVQGDNQVNAPVAPAPQESWLDSAWD